MNQPTVNPTTPGQLLRFARDIIKAPQYWCAGDYARDRFGSPCKHYSPTALQFSARAAMQKAHLVTVLGLSGLKPKVIRRALRAYKKQNKKRRQALEGVRDLILGKTLDPVKSL